MAGSPFKDAWRARLAYHRNALGYTTTWPIKDTDNTSEQPGVPAAATIGFLELDFPGGSPSRLAYFRQPGSNLHQTEGQVTVRVVTPLRRSQAVREAAEVIAEQIAQAFLADRFTPLGGREIRVTGVSPISDGHDEGGNYVEAILVAWENLKVG